MQEIVPKYPGENDTWGVGAQKAVAALWSGVPVLFFEGVVVVLLWWFGFGWGILLAVLLMVTLSVVRMIRIRRRRQRASGTYCRNCGYDLRASPVQCPECGEFTRQAIAEDRGSI